MFSANRLSKEHVCWPKNGPVPGWRKPLTQVSPREGRCLTGNFRATRIGFVDGLPAGSLCGRGDSLDGRTHRLPQA